MRILASLFLVLVFHVASAQLSAEKYIALARGDLDQMRYSSAVSRLNFALKTQPFNIEAWFLRAMAKYNLGDYQGAIEDYTQCVRLNPTSPAPFQNRGLSRAKLNDHYGAIEDYDRAIKIEPGSYFLYINKTYSQLQMELYDDAINTCNTAIGLNPYLESGYMMRGLAEGQKELFQEAIEDFSKVIKINPENAEAYLRRAMAKNETLDPEGAKLDCDTAIALDSLSSMGYFVKGNIYAEQFKYEEAEAMFSKVIELNPNNALAYYNRGNARTRMDDYRGAAYDFDRVTDINPKNPLGHYNLALTYHKLDRYELALDEYSKVIELFPEMEDAWFNRAFVKKHLGDEKGAHLDFMKGNELRAKNRNKEYDLAEAEQLEKITELDADFYKPAFDEEEEQIQVFNFPFFEISEVDYQRVTKPHLKYNFPQLNEFNDGNQNLPYFYVSHWLMPELQRDSVRWTQLKNTKESDRKDEEKQRSLLWQAINYKKEFDFNNALATYDTLTTRYPLFALGYFNKANTMLDLLELLLKLESGEGEFIDLGEDITPIQLKDVQTLSVHLKQIEHLYRQSLDFDPDLHYAWFNLALVLSEQGEFDESVDAYTKALKVKSEFPEALYNRGVTYLYLENEKKACNDFSKAGELGIEEAYKLVRKYCN